MKHHHMRFDIKGLLLWRNLKGLFTENGQPVSDQKARLFLMDELQKGHAYYPLGKCDNFDYVKDGCRGHEEEDKEEGENPCTNS